MQLGPQAPLPLPLQVLLPARLLPSRVRWVWPQVLHWQALQQLLLWPLPCNGGRCCVLVSASETEDQTGSDERVPLKSSGCKVAAEDGCSGSKN
jgi:hypothetical protein